MAEEVKTAEETVAKEVTTEAQPNIETARPENAPEAASEAPGDTPPPSKDKNALARTKVEHARRQVEEAEAEIEECLRRIEEDLDRFESYENEVLVPVMRRSRRLLSEVGTDAVKIPENPLSEVELIDPEEERIEIGEISSGKVGAFFWSLLAGAATVGGWYVYAVQKLGLGIVPAQTSDWAFFSKLAAAIAAAFGQGENPAVGWAIVVASALAVMGIVYAVIVALRASKNLKTAERLEEEASFYCTKKSKCKEKMEAVRKHLETLDATARKYEVLLEEQNAALRRALHIEGNKKLPELHEKTQKLVAEMVTLLNALDTVLETPMARHGVLTPESVEALRRAKRVVNDQILRIYNG
ncbi:hypothetical protein [Nitratifractor sp.]